MGAGQRFMKLGVCCGLALMAVGCASERRGRGEPSVATVESELNRAWAGKPYTELLAAYGEPEMVMNIPANGTISAVVLYPKLDKLPSKCAHAFTVQRGAEPKVVKYVCQ